jgi:hypothetical protein
MDPDPDADPTFFVSDLQDVNKKVFCLLLFEDTFKSLFKAVLRIHDILGWIRIRIRGSMPLTNGSGSFYFRH